MLNALIIDDDPIVADLNRLSISRVADFHCCGVTAMISDTKAMLSHLVWIDLLLLDVYMQQESDLDLLPALRTDGRNTDVVMTTSAADTFTLQTALYYGMMDYLIKPFQFPRSEETLQTQCKRREVVQTKSCYARADIDTLLRRGTPQQENTRRLPKGLTSQTLRLVCQRTDDHQARDFPTNGLAAALQISRMSYRKYLIWLEQVGILFTINYYGVAGRPGYHYRLVVENLMLLTQYNQ